MLALVYFSIHIYSVTLILNWLINLLHNACVNVISIRDA